MNKPLRELPDMTRKLNIIIAIPEGEKREEGAKSLFKEIWEFPKPGKGLGQTSLFQDRQVHEANRSFHYLRVKRPYPRHIIMQLKNQW